MSDIPSPSNPRSSKIKLALFGLVVLAILAGSMISGVMKRAELHERGGSVIVRVSNESPTRARADVYMADQYATLELDPAETGVLRFMPRNPATPLRFDLFRGGEQRASVNHGMFAEGAKADVIVQIGAEDELGFQQTDREGP